MASARGACVACGRLKKGPLVRRTSGATVGPGLSYAGLRSKVRANALALSSALG
jgi:hypothetical protein